MISIESMKPVLRVYGYLFWLCPDNVNDYRLILELCAKKGASVRGSFFDYLEKVLIY